MKTFLYLFMIVHCVCSCKTRTSTGVAVQEESAKDSIEVISKSFENKPDLIEYEVSVLRGTSTKHGLQKRFYRHGSLYSSIPYLNGKREGLAYTYYPAAEGSKPMVWKEQPYINNLLHGTCRRYHKNGQLQSEYDYKEGMPGLGIKEYSQSGKLIKQPNLVVKSVRVATGFYISAQLSDNNQNVDYYLGKLDEGRFLPRGLKELQVKKGLGEVVVESYGKKVTITAIYTSRYRNKCMLSKTINL